MARPARVGRFGRLPRARSSLASILVAIAREQESRRDQNIMDAWRQGGMFEGERVTDEMMLAHWRGRLEGISPDDPLYDTYRNAVMQFEYAIEESKMTMEYAHERVSDAQMAAFYTRWARKMPKDSEIYRELQRDAAQFLARARQRGRANAQTAKADAYSQQMEALELQQRSGQFVMSVITHLAQQGVGGRGAFMPQEAVGGLQDVTGATNIAGMPILNIGSLMSLVSQVNLQEWDPAPAAVRRGMEEDLPRGVARPEGFDGGRDAWMFTDDQGKAWTRGEILDQMRAFDPGFEGAFTVEYVADRLNAQADVIRQQIEVATEAGEATHAARLRQRLSVVTEQAQQARAWPVAQRYVEIWRRIEEIKGSGALMPGVKRDLVRAELRKIGHLANDPSIAGDGNLQSRLRDEANLVVGSISLMEDLTGTRFAARSPEIMGAQPVDTNIGRLRAFIEHADYIEQEVQANRAVMTQGRRERDPATGQLIFTPIPGGPDWGPATEEQLAALRDINMAQLTLVPNGDGSGFTPALIVPIPIVAVARDPRLHGRVKIEAGKEPVGFVFEYHANGQRVQSFVMQGAEGRFLGIDPNFDPALLRTAQRGRDGIEIDVSANILAQIDKASVENLPGDARGRVLHVPGVQGMRVEGRTVSRVVEYEEPAPRVDPIRGTVSPFMDPRHPVLLARQRVGTVYVNMPSFVLGTDPTLLRGYDKTTDSPSLLLSSVKQITEGETFLRSVQGTPVYDLVMRRSLAWSLLTTTDFTTGEVVVPEGREQFYQDMRESIQYDERPLRVRKPGDLEQAARDLLGIGAMRRDRRAGTTGVRGVWGLYEPEFAQPLPLDALREAEDPRLAALYNGMQPQTNLIAARRPPADAITIRPGTDLSLPQIDLSTLPGMRDRTYEPPPLTVRTREVERWEPPPMAAQTAQVGTRTVGGQKWAPAPMTRGAPRAL